VEHEGARNQEHSVAPQNPFNFVEAAPKISHVLERAQGDDRADGGVGVR
jgi:hypothetical protein